MLEKAAALAESQNMSQNKQVYTVLLVITVSIHRMFLSYLNNIRYVKSILIFDKLNFINFILKFRGISVLALIILVYHSMSIRFRSLVHFYCQMSEPVYFTVSYNPQVLIKKVLKTGYKTFVKANLMLLPNIFKKEENFFLNQDEKNVAVNDVSCRLTIVKTNIFNLYLSRFFVVVILITFSLSYLSRMASSMISIEL